MDFESRSALIAYTFVEALGQGFFFAHIRAAFCDHREPFCRRSYRLVGSSGLEPPTSCLSGTRSNLLSYEPVSCFRRCLPHRFFSSRSLKIEQQLLLFCLYTVVCTSISPYPHVLHRKEVIQPHLPIRLPCYDLTPITEPTFGHVLLAVRLWTSGVFDFHGLTGGVYKARERIHRSMLICDY